MENILIGGIASAVAGIVTNPLENIKVRVQLQGELQAKGFYVVHYRNVFHAAFTIWKKDGMFALQKGLLPCLCYQFFSNGIRLGGYQIASNQGLLNRRDGSKSTLKLILVSASTGIIGNVFGSPFYLVKTHLQSRANDVTIAVGHQHNIKGMFSAFQDIFRNYGVRGLWRGTTSQVPRLAVGSATQLLTFEKAQDYVADVGLFERKSWGNVLLASFISGLFVTTAMAPFDLLATRFYNQGVDANGRGILYSNIFNCAKRVAAEEGLLAFFKGWTVAYLRLGPYTLISLIAWDRLKLYHKTLQR